MRQVLYFHLNHCGHLVWQSTAPAVPQTARWGARWGRWTAWCRCSGPSESVGSLSSTGSAAGSAGRSWNVPSCCWLAAGCTAEGRRCCSSWMERHPSGTSPPRYSSDGCNKGGAGSRLLVAATTTTTATILLLLHLLQVLLLYVQNFALETYCKSWVNALNCHWLWFKFKCPMLMKFLLSKIKHTRSCSCKDKGWGGRGSLQCCLVVESYNRLFLNPADRLYWVS